MALLSVTDAELYYDHVYALKGVSIEVGEDETVALIGANGAGKSSILRAITGLRRLHSGAVHFAGKRIDGAAPDAIVKMGIVMVPEGRRVFPLMSVRDNLLMGAFTRTDKAGIAENSRRRAYPFPAPQGADRPAGGHSVGRRAADAGHWPGPDGEAEIAPAR